MQKGEAPGAATLSRTDLPRSAPDAGRNLVCAGISERVAMVISGHMARAVLDHYNIVSARDLKEAARKLEACLTAESDDKTATISPSATQAMPNAKPN